MEKKYWIIVNDQQRGPFDINTLIGMPEFGPQTPAWREGLADWTAAGNIPELAPLWANAYYGTPQPAAPVMTAADPRNGSYQAPMPPTYLVWAIISTICCCLPAGVVAIFYAAKVSPAYQAGDLEAARKASEKAAWWVVISFVAGLISAPFSVLLSMM